MVDKVLFSSRSEEWPTPRGFFDELDAEFAFTLDPCATRENAKCRYYFTKRDDGLGRDWAANVVFCNPPYGKDIRRWARKCYEASQLGATVVLLAHARTDTRWFHDWVLGKAELRFVRGRLKFGSTDQSAPFPSLIAIYRPAPRGLFAHLIAGRLFSSLRIWRLFETSRARPLDRVLSRFARPSL